MERLLIQLHSTRIQEQHILEMTDICFCKTGGELVYIDKKDILGNYEFKKAEVN